MSDSNAFREGQEVRIYVAHEDQDVWCRIDHVRPASGLEGQPWYDVTPVDPADSNVAMVSHQVVKEVRDGH